MGRNPNWRPPGSTAPNPNTAAGRASTTRPPPSATTISRPGAYTISRNAQGSPQVFRVTIPPNVGLNQEFQVYAGDRIVRVRRPPNTQPGQAVQITIPADDLVTNASENMAVLTSADGEGGGGAVRMNSVTRIVNRGSGSIDERSNSASTSNGDHTSNNAPSTPTLPQAYNVQVPAGVRPGSTFPVSLNGQTIQVQCPTNARPGMTVRIVPPPSLLAPPTGMQSATSLNRPPDGRGQNSNTRTNKTRKTVNQTFEVTVPKGVRPNQPFSLIAGGQRVLVTCPPNARPGTRIRFQLPISVDADDSTGNSKDNVDVSL
eukprot:scaffold11289_cov256-Chaetoceros_neogracile.AAC.1